jgi:hypothetical protein
MHYTISNLPRRRDEGELENKKTDQKIILEKKVKPLQHFPYEQKEKIF